jgi:hypothetical protein
MKRSHLRRNLQLDRLALDLVQLERAVAERRVNTAIEDARRRTATSARPDLLKWYQVDYALELIGSGQSVPIIARKLHCGPATLYQAIAAVPARSFYS